MGRAEIFQGRVLSPFVLTLAAAGTASAAAIFVLFAIHSSPGPDNGSHSPELAAAGDGMSAEERRELTRQMLKARRENPEIPAEVRPVPSSRPATSGTADGVADVKARPERAAPMGAGAASTRSAARSKPEAPVQAPLAAAAGAAAAPAPAQGTMLPPMVVSSPAVTLPPRMVAGDGNPAAPEAASDPGATPEPVRRGFAANVFSTISGFAGTAANATGNTVNWVIELPGKAISAGGRLLGGDSASSSPPPAAPAAPKRS